MREHLNRRLSLRSKSLTVLSSDAVRRRRSSEENCTERTPAEWALITWLLPLTFGFHSRTVLSLEADASRRPDGAYVTSCTGPVCPANLNARMRGLKFQTMIRESSPAEAICFMFGLKLIERIAPRWPRKVRSIDGMDSSAASRKNASSLRVDAIFFGWRVVEVVGRERNGRWAFFDLIASPAFGALCRGARGEGWRVEEEDGEWAGGGAWRGCESIVLRNEEETPGQVKSISTTPRRPQREHIRASASCIFGDSETSNRKDHQHLQRGACSSHLLRRRLPLRRYSK